MSSSLPRTSARQPYLMIIGGARVGELHKLTAERTIVGRSPDAQLRLSDTGISREHAELVVDGGRLRVRDLGSTNGTFLNGERADARELADGDKLSLGAATLLVFTHQDGIEDDYQRGRFRATVRDGVTTALRRDVFLDRLAQEVSFSRRHAAPLALLSWEIDAFTTTTERLGPLGTRSLLAAVTRAASATLREDDVLATLGPGRFAVACRETSGHAAQARADRLRAVLAETAFDVGASSVRLTVSVGVTTCPVGSDEIGAATAALLRTAERMLDAARARGGNSVELAPSSDE
ncbi:MAG TPA: FHA domain-containing protein [Polyangia bacterium]|nr:FHA domain-containing protein [Polyangia bacterium]